IRTGGLTAKEIFGYTYQGNYTPPGYQASQTRWNPYVYRFYYNRTNYKIDYYFNGSRLRTIDRIPFERSIDDSTHNYIPERPNNVDPDYTWGGWYTDS
ncbi:hypothetical protein, partial [Streptococcus suis]